MNPYCQFSQRGAATLLVAVMIILLITVGSFASSRQITGDSKANNHLFFRTKALEAANAGLAAIIADILDPYRKSTYLNNLTAFTTLKDPELKSTKYDLNEATFSLLIKQISDDPASGMQRIHVVSTGCYPDCSSLSGKAVVEQDILVAIAGGINNDWLSVNNTINRISDSSVNVHEAPQGTTGTAAGAGINNCKAGDVHTPLNCEPAGTIKKVPPEGGIAINVYQPLKQKYDASWAPEVDSAGKPVMESDPNIYYTNWAPKATAPAGTDCTREPAMSGPDCEEQFLPPYTGGKSPLLPAVRPVLDGANYFKKYYGTTDKSKIKSGIEKGLYSAEGYPASSYLWIEDDVELKDDGKLYKKSNGSFIDVAGKHVIINGNLTSVPALSMLSIPPEKDLKWRFMYVTKNVEINASVRISGALAIEGNFNIHGSLMFYVDSQSKNTFTPFSTTSYGGKSGWRDFK